MQVKELIKQLKQLDEDLDIYLLSDVELQETIIQTMDFSDDKYYILTTN